MKQVGIWIIGAYGSVAAAAVAGAKGRTRELVGTTGLLTEIPDFQDVGFLPFEQMVFGGHEVRKGSLRESFIQLSEVAHLKHDVTVKLSQELEAVESEVCLGTALGCGKGISEFADTTEDIDSLLLSQIVDRLAADISDFKNKHSLKSVIVVNLSSTEPPAAPSEHFQTLEGFESALHENRKDIIRASMLYTYAAFRSGCPYINFTPSAGASMPALQQLAKEQGLPHAGRDGKTGETLVKSVLSTVFKYRMLKVLSWQGYNILGNLDGKVLKDPESKQSKIETKDGILPQILGYSPHTHVGIDYVPSLGDWKVAWDFIHFEGFLGTRMSMQFIWQGCDSILAAPLVLDLIRLIELSYRRGESGALRHTALFFKQPIGCNVGDLHGQWHILWEYLQKVMKEEKA